jgi:hypothetical protein
MQMIGWVIVVVMVYMIVPGMHQTVALVVSQLITIPYIGITTLSDTPSTYTHIF